MNSKGSATLLQHLTTHAASITENVAAAANSTLRKIKKQTARINQLSHCLNHHTTAEIS